MNNLITSEETHPRWRSIVFAILFAEGLTVGAFAVTVPVLAFILSDLFGLEGSELIRWNSRIFIVASIGMAIFSPIWGTLADRLGKRLMLVRAMLGGMIVVFLMTFVQSPTQLVVLRALQGAFTGSIAAATVLILAFTPKSHSATMLALLQVAIMAGNSLGPLIGGWLYDVLKEWDHSSNLQLAGRVNFLFTSMLLGCSAIIVIKFVPKDTVKSKKDRATGKSLFRPDFSALKTNAILPTLLLVTFVVSVAFSIVNPVFPLFIKSILPSAANLGRTSGIITGSAALAVALGAITFARLGRIFPMERLILIAITGAAIFYIPQVYSHNWQMLLTFRLLESFFVGGITPGISYLLSTHTPSEKHGSVFGLSASLNAVGTALGPALGAVIAQHYTLPSVFITGSGLLLSLVIILTMTSRVTTYREKKRLQLLEQNESSKE
ncbi:MFS transporter [Entomospira entomophila]|uniref:Multidrug efflux MFS transporter n=1 Tax=Entomospira entomophila TaxID=2719988 RepID=A0A968G8Z3_9SPIO|nr:MFS transporter [Entomospira entomophilus]NIZ40752.1 multidrug efflux MFS transporter [Entomospira entomophilus]WDI34965.1 MFS transporter [Entomospira entomophilus]